MFSLGLFLGTISCAYTLDRFGPRKAAMAASIALMAGVAVQVTSESREQLLAGKVSSRTSLLITCKRLIVGKPLQLLAGIPLGVLQVAASNFIAESAPSRLRVPLAATIGMANIIGIILGITTGSQVIHFAKSGESMRMQRNYKLVVDRTVLQTGSLGSSPSQCSGSHRC